MSDNFNQKNNDFSNINSPQNQSIPTYQGDPWMEQQALQEKKKGCGGCLWGCGCGCLTLILLAVVGSIVFYYQCFRGVPMVVAPETTLITEPLRSDGKMVDFFKAIEDLSIPNIAAEQNGFTNVLKAYGKAIFEAEGRPTRTWQYEETCKKLGLDPDAAAEAVFEKPNDFVSGRADTESLAKLASTPWTFEEQPKMKDWFEKVGPGLDIVQQAAMKEHYFMPMVRRNDKELVFLSISLEALNFQSELAKSLQIRAMQRLGANDAEGAWKDTIASLRLARFVFAGLDYSDFEKNIQEKAKEANQGGQFDADDFKDVLTMIFSSKAQTIGAFIKYDSWTKEQLDRYIADLESLPNWPERKTLLKTQQFLVLDLLGSMNDMQAFAQSIEPKATPGDTGKPFTMFGMNWNVLAKLFNEKFKEYESSMNDNDAETLVSQSHDEIIEGLNSNLKAIGDSLSGKDVAGMLTVSGRSRLIGKFVGEILPFIEKLIYKEELNENARIQILRAAFALKRYKIDKDEYPQSLDELKLKKLNPILPIQYEKTANGYVLSCGNLKIEFP